MQINQDFKYSFDNDILSFGDNMVCVDDEDQIRPELRLITLIDGVQCSKCEHVVEARDLESHQATYLCPIEEGAVRVRATEYVQVHGREDTLAVRRALNIPSMMIPSMYNVYVPSWVADAIRGFHVANGYADLSLEEFLRKLGDVSPEQAKEISRSVNIETPF